MKLTSITAKNFRSLEDIHIQFSTNYCTISGKNNAGKSSVIRLLMLLFGAGNVGDFLWMRDSTTLDFKDDLTQWAVEGASIEVTYQILLTLEDDPALISFIERMAKIKAGQSSVDLTIQYRMSSADDSKITVTCSNKVLDSQESKEINKKVRESNLMFLYNSTNREEQFFYSGGRNRRFYGFVMSHEEEKELEDASKNIDRKLKKITRQHTEGLNAILGKLADKYDVEFSPPGKSSMRHAAFGINLRDKHVEVPLSDWGSGTQNRTQILMAILQANRIKTTYSLEDKITPIVVIEEPESFLHPSAQSEFGRILGTLSGEFGVQIIATTHSPYMLNREDPKSNILLCRENKRGKHNKTLLVAISDDSWMAPFAENLGINSSEFAGWQPFFSARKSKILLVEGDLDKQYFEELQKEQYPIERLSDDIEVVPYGGKDTLKHTLLVKFVLSKFDKVFITYDRDADSETQKALSRLGLIKEQDHTCIGLSDSGKECIEGLLPQRVLSVVNGRETDLVMKLSSSERRDAKQRLKKMYLEEFRKNKDYSKDELKHFDKLVKLINKCFAKS